MALEISSAYLSMHQPLTNRRSSSHHLLRIERHPRRPGRLHLVLASQARPRLARERSERDLYFGSPDPNSPGKVDLARREASIIDLEPKKGGEVNVMVEDIESFELKYLDSTTGLWTETWDTSQATGQLNRLPFEVKISLSLKGGADGKPVNFVTKVTIPRRLRSSFAVAK